MIIQMIQHSPKLLRSNLLWIERDVLLDESRRGGLIIPPSLKLLSSSVSFLRRAVLRSGGADAPRLHHYRLFGIDEGHVRGVRIPLGAAYDRHGS
ncbi:hypothetical protein ACF1BQ_031605 [Bradyrhizobium sp. RDT10]